MLPNFLIAGVVASGTSYLSSTLAHHPDIYLPKIQRPEPNFFHFPDVIEYIRKEKGFSPLITSDEDEKKFALLSANLVDGVKTPLTNTNRQSLQKLLTEEIARLKDTLDFSISDWV